MASAHELVTEQRGYSCWEISRSRSWQEIYISIGHACGALAMAVSLMRKLSGTVEVQLSTVVVTAAAGGQSQYR